MKKQRSWRQPSCAFCRRVADLMEARWRGEISAEEEDRLTNDLFDLADRVQAAHIAYRRKRH